MTEEGVERQGWKGAEWRGQERVYASINGPLSKFLR